MHWEGTALMRREMDRSSLGRYATSRLRDGGRRLAVEQLEERRVLSIAPSLITDANDANAHQGLWRQDLTVVGDAVYFSGQSSFSAQNVDIGNGLWRSDGTPSGTILVKEIPQSAPLSYGPRYLANVAGTLYFWTKREGEHWLWTSDGTEAGTEPIKQLQPEVVFDLRNGFNSWQEFNGEYYFSADDGDGFELWKSDGTSAGTVQVADIFLGTGNSSPRRLTNVDGILYFGASSGSAATELWRSDGSTAGTVRVAALPGTSPHLGPMTAVGERFFFAFDDGVHGTELWTSDGTAVGTKLVKDIRPGASGWWANVEQLVNLNGTLYFAANQSGWMEMWRSDGTEAGTQRVDSTSTPSPRHMINVGGVLYFARGDALWKRNGTSGGAVLVVKSNTYAITSLANADGILYFTTSSQYNTYDRTLWKSDGTAAGTKRIQLFPDGFKSEVYTKSVATGESLYFVADDPANGGEQLWKTDAGLGVGLEILSGKRAETQSGNPTDLTVVGDAMYYISRSSTHWTSLWKTDGQRSELVKNLRPTPVDNYQQRPSEMLNVSGTLYFIATDGEHGYELWKSDGTPQGTVMVKDVNTADQSLTAKAPRMLTNVNGELYFMADDNLYGSVIWKSDGTSSGTVPAVQYLLGTKQLVAYKERLYFFHTSYPNSQLWMTDGTGAGTLQVTSSSRQFSVTSGIPPVVAGDWLYFIAEDNVAGSELWKTDGTDAGTSIVKDIVPGRGSSEIRMAWSVGSELYFSIVLNGQLQLWATNGQASGTRVVHTLPSQYGLEYDDLIEHDGDIYFSMGPISTIYDPSSVWKIDGSTAAVSLVAEFTDQTYFNRHLTSLGNQVYFMAISVVGDAIAAPVLDSAGVTTPTRLGLHIPQLPYFPYWSKPVAFNSNIYFSASDGYHGFELWRLLGAPPMAGDYNHDGVVDGNDFLVWQRNFGSAASPAGSGADGDGDGVIGSGDLDQWKASFGEPSAGLAVASMAGESSTDVAVEAAIVSVKTALDGEFEQSAGVTALEGNRHYARDAIFAAGDFSRLYALGYEGEAETLLGRRRVLAGRRW